MESNFPYPNEDVEYRKTAIEPIECLKSGKQLVGDQYWLFVGICLVGTLIGSAAPLNVLLGPMMCGVYLCYLHRARGEQVSFGLLFKGFDYFVESLLATLVLTGVVLLCMVPLYLLFCGGIFAAAAGNQGHDEPPILMFITFGVFFVGIFVVSIFVGVFFIFIYLLIVDRGLKAIPAVKTSFKAAKANFGGLLGLTALNMLLSMVGVCVCYVGALFVAPICFGAVVEAYRKVFPDPNAAMANKPPMQKPPPLHSPAT